MRTMAAVRGGNNTDMPSFNIRQSIATKVAAKKTGKGYTLSEENCGACQMPLMTLQGKSSCKVCPAIKKWVDRKNEGSRQEQRGEDSRDVVESSESAEEIREEAPVESVVRFKESEVTDFEDLSKADSTESDDTNAIRERARQIIKNAKCSVVLDPVEDDESLAESPQAKWDGDMEWVEDRLIRDRAAQIIKQARKNIQAERGDEWCENVHFEPVTKAYDHYKMMSATVQEVDLKLLSTKVVQAIPKVEMGSDEIPGEASIKTLRISNSHAHEDEIAMDAAQKKEVDPKLLSTKVVQAVPKVEMGSDEIAGKASIKALRISNNHAHEDEIAMDTAQKKEYTSDAKAPQNESEIEKNLQEDIDRWIDSTAKSDKAPLTPSAYVSFKDFAKANDVAKSLPTTTADVTAIATEVFAKADDVAKSPRTPAESLSKPTADVSTVATKECVKADGVAKSLPTPIACMSSMTHDDAKSPPATKEVTDNILDVSSDTPIPSLGPTSTEIKPSAANARVSFEEQSEIVHYSEDAIIAVQKGVPMNETNSTGIISGIASKVDGAVEIFKSLVSCNAEDLDVPFEDEVSAARKQQLAHLQSLQRQQEQLMQQQMIMINNGSYTDGGCEDGLFACGDRSAQESPVELVECDYDFNPTELYLAIQCKDWESATNRAATFPKEASIWVSRIETSGRLRWRLLPLHAALIFHAPNGVISALLSAFSRGIACMDDQKKLPLHLAIRHGCDENVLHTLLVAYPHSIDVQDRKGRTPMVLAHKSDHVERDMYIRALEKGPAYYNHPLIKYNNPRYREKVTYEVEETYHLGLLGVNSGPLSVKSEDGPAPTVASQYYEPQPTQMFPPQHFEPAEKEFVPTQQHYAANGFQYVPTMMMYGNPQGNVYQSETHPPMMPVYQSETHTPMMPVYPSEMRPPIMPTATKHFDTKENVPGDADLSEGSIDAMRRVNDAKAFIMSRNTVNFKPTSHASTAPFMPQMDVSMRGYPTESCFSRQGSLAPGAQANTFMPHMDTIAPRLGTIANITGSQTTYQRATTVASPQVLRSKGSLMNPEDEDENNNHHADKISLSPKMSGKHFFA